MPWREHAWHLLFDQAFTTSCRAVSPPSRHWPPVYAQPCRCSPVPSWTYRRREGHARVEPVLHLASTVGFRCLVKRRHYCQGAASPRAVLVAAGDLVGSTRNLAREQLLVHQGQLTICGCLTPTAGLECEHRACRVENRFGLAVWRNAEAFVGWPSYASNFSRSGVGCEKRAEAGHCFAVVWFGLWLHHRETIGRRTARVESLVLMQGQLQWTSVCDGGMRKSSLILWTRTYSWQSTRLSMKPAYMLAFELFNITSDFGEVRRLPWPGLC